MVDKANLLARHGLTLSRNVLRRLTAVGIVAQPQVSLEHQNLTKRYVIRGIESGGAVKEIGRYVTFAEPTGEPLPYLHPLDAIGVNGVHAVVVAPALVRIEIFRVGRTWQLLITEHRPAEADNGRRPRLSSKRIFAGINGLMVPDFSRQSSAVDAAVVPQFWSRAGESIQPPNAFLAGIAAASRGAACIGCSHSHFLHAPMNVTTNLPELETREEEPLHLG